MSQIKYLKTQVTKILVKDEQSRNSDIRLTQCIWWEFYQEKMVKLEDGSVAVRLRDMFDLPREDNIKRIRAKIQNEDHKFLPTDPEIRRKRQIKEEEWREYLGLLNPSRG